MNRLGIIVGVALLAAAMSSMTFAQSETTSGLTNISLASLSDAPAAYDPGATAGTTQASDQPGAPSAAEEPAPAPGPQPWKLPQPCLFQKLGINMGGWVQQGITYDSWNPVDRFNGPQVTNDRSGEYQLNQAWLYFVKPTKTDGCGFDIGGRVDVDYGTDWRFGQCAGLETRIDDPNSFYGLVLPQFYLEVAYDDLTVKMGHFATLTSLEVVPAPLNFFYSHTYLMGGYYDPLLVTGLQAEYKLSDNLTAIGGFNRGWQLFENPNETFNFLGGVKWSSDDKKSSLSVMTIDGPTMTFAGYHNVDNLIAVYTRQLNECWWMGAQATVGREDDGSLINPGRDDTWYGFELLLTRKLNAKWSAGVRYEWVQDNEGSRVAGIGNVLGTDRGWTGAPGFAGNFSDVTVGLNYRPNANWVVRPELRADFYNGQPNVLNQLPFNTFGSSYQLTAAVDAIVTF